MSTSLNHTVVVLLVSQTSFYPITYVISWLPSTVNRVLEGINRSLINSTAPWAAQLFSVQLGGFLYVLAD